MNGPYDPDYTGTGHQPPNFDNLMNMYLRYRVYKVTAKVTFINTASHAQRVALYGRRTTTTESNPLLHDLAVDRKCTMATLTPATGSKNIVTLRKTFYPGTFYKGENYAKDIAFSGTGSNVPSSQCYINLGVYSLDKTTQATINYEVDLIYHTRLERISEVEMVLED
jgi:hypothetical protein